MKELTVSFEHPLPGALVAQVGQTRIIRSSTEDLKKIIEYAGSSGIAFVQYNTEENEWGKTIEEHRNLSEIKQPHVHLNFPIQPALYPKPPREKTFREKEIADTLPKLLNMEGWAMYSSWLDEQFEEALTHFNFDAVEMYTLQAYLEDFHHEVFSDLLSKNLIAIHELDLPGSLRTIDEEKQLIKLRQELRRMIEAHHAILSKIVLTIQAIEQTYPELTQIGDLSILLRNILENQLLPFDRAKMKWGLQEMCLQLLDDGLGVQPILNCSEDNGRTYFAMALRIAMMQLKENHSVRELIQMIDAWDNDTTLVKKFKSHVLENIKRIHEVKPHGGQALEPGLIPNLEYLNYLPHDKHFIIYDPSTGIPSGLTEAGQRLLVF